MHDVYTYAPVLYYIITFLIEVHFQYFTELVSLRELGKPISRAKVSSPNFSHLKAVEGAHIGSALLYDHNTGGGGYNSKEPILNMGHQEEYFGASENGRYKMLENV